MKLVTHNLFSLGLVLYVASLFVYLGLLTVVFALPATVLTNLVIDKVGHVGAGGVSRRAWITHSVVTAPLWGGAIWGLTIIFPAALLGVFPPNPQLLGLFVALGALAGWSHLLLDSVTEGGVFGLDVKRRAAGHFAYDNRALNLGCSFLGLALLVVAIMS